MNLSLLPYFRPALAVALLLLVCASAGAADPALANGWRFEEIRRFPAPEARQGVAVDADHFYAINNHALGKYRKDSGERVASWEGDADGTYIHLNSGVVREGRLICAHSNYPAVPMLSSLEIFDTATLEPVASHSFGNFIGSLVWVDKRQGAWFAGFAHYQNRGAEPGRDASWSAIVQFDDAWRVVQRWAYPPALVTRFAGYSASGGGFGPENKLFVAGHDATELYVIDFPKAGSVMRWLATIPVPFEGQAFAWDPAAEGVLYSILKRTREVIVGRVRPPEG